MTSLWQCSRSLSFTLNSRSFHSASQIIFKRSRLSYGNVTRTIANDLDDWDDLDRLDRIGFHPDDREDRVNFEAIIWKRSQTTETIESCPRNHLFYSSNREEILPGLRWNRKKNTKMFSPRMGNIGNKIFPCIKFWTWWFVFVKPVYSRPLVLRKIG